MTRKPQNKGRPRVLAHRPMTNAERCRRSRAKPGAQQLGEHRKWKDGWDALNDAAKVDDVEPERPSDDQTAKPYPEGTLSTSNPRRMTPRDDWNTKPVTVIDAKPTVLDVAAEPAKPAPRTWDETADAAKWR